MAPERNESVSTRERYLHSRGNHEHSGRASSVNNQHSFAPRADLGVDPRHNCVDQEDHRRAGVLCLKTGISEGLCKIKKSVVLLRACICNRMVA